ncbi:MAG: penicillin-binding transpeptidase domain-containing protein, partial [Pseudomonadales bacterium]
SYSAYDDLLHDINRPLYDRALLGQYPPGSTVKPLYALAGLATGAVTKEWSIMDYGRFQLPNQERVYRDWKREGHGRVDMRIAIEQSCDVYFYELGNMVGIDVLSEFGHLFGLGQKTGIDMPSEMSGIMPSREWKRAARGLAWYPGDTINASIGQGFSLATPLQLAQMTANIARRGVSLKPHMVHAVNEIEVEVSNEPLVDINSEHWNTVHSAMEDVVHSIRGTASAQGRDLTFRMAGKTGTAQVVGIPQDAEYDPELLEEFMLDHALFVSFAPVEDPKIAIAVVVENGEHGSSVAAPVARELTKQWLSENPWVVSQAESSETMAAGEEADAI